MVQHSSSAAMSSAAAGNKTGLVSSLQGLRPLPLSLPRTASSKRQSKSKRPRVVINDDGDDVRAPRRRPVILYENTPEVIYARPDEFKALVQRLTGQQPNGTAGGSGDQDQEAVLRPAETAPAAAAQSSQQEEQDPLVLTLGQQHVQPAPLPLVVDDEHHHTPPVLPPPSPGGGADGGFLLSPSSFLFSPATLEAIHDLIS